MTRSSQRKVLFRCDSGEIPKIGRGHARRSILLAEFLQAQGCQITFAGELDDWATERIRRSGFALEPRSTDESEVDLLHRAVTRYAPEVVVVDRLDTSAEDLKEIRDIVPVIITFDDLGSGAALADVVVNSIVKGSPYDSYDLLVLPPPNRTVETRDAARCVVSVGGYDLDGLGARTARALATDARLQVHLLTLSPDLDKDLSSEGIQVHRDSSDFDALLARAGIAVVNGGLTLFEALSKGVPAIAIGRYDHEIATIERLERLGATRALKAEDIETRITDLVGEILEGDTAEKLSRRAREVVQGDGLSLVAELIRVIDRLDWDSDFFGVNIGMINPTRLTDRLLGFCLQQADEMDLDCVYYLCDCHHAESVRLAESRGFHFVDIRMTLERKLCAQDLNVEAATIRRADPNDLSQLRSIASDSYDQSRYYFDRQFPKHLCEKFYADWIQGCLEGRLADEVFVLDDDGVRGYLAIAESSASTGRIVLLGVDKNARGAGVGQKLVTHASRWAIERGLSRMEVATQGRNYAAQRAYQKAGFQTQKLELWYHLWT